MSTPKATITVALSGRATVTERVAEYVTNDSDPPGDRPALRWCGSVRVSQTNRTSTICANSNTRVKVRLHYGLGSVLLNTAAAVGAPATVGAACVASGDATADGAGHQRAEREAEHDGWSGGTVSFFIYFYETTGW